MASSYLVLFADRSVVNVLFLDGASSIPAQEANQAFCLAWPLDAIQNAMHILRVILTYASASEF